MSTISHPLALILKQTYEGDYQGQQLVQILSSLIETEEEQFDYTNIPYEYISTIIHNLYLINNPSVRGYLLRLIGELDASASSSIIETYHFDKLVVFSLDKRQQDLQPLKDDEKKSAFRIIGYLLKIRRHIPDSILRALAAYYLQTNVNSVSKSAALLYMCESAIISPQQLLSVPEVGQIIVDNLVETGNINICGLITLAIERGHKYLSQKYFLSHLITPFATFKASDDLSSISNTISAICNIFRTWPGLLHCGFQIGMIKDLIECLPHQTDAVVAVFRDLLVLQDPTPSATSVFDPYSGLLLYGLTKYGLINQLHKVSQTNTAAASFLNFILPYVTIDENSTNLMPTASHRANFVAQKCDSMAFHLNKSDMKSNNVTTIKGFVLDSNELKWNWGGILKLMTVILPHNEIEAKLPDTINIYTKLLNYFSSDKYIGASDKNEALTAMINLLTSGQYPSGFQVLDNHKNFAAVLKKNVETLKENVETHWPIFKSILALMKTENGTLYLQKYKISEVLRTLGETCTSLELVNEVVKNINIVEDGIIGFQVIISFLNSKIDEIHHIAAAKVKSYLNTSIDFADKIFKTVVLSYIKDSQGSQHSLALFVELIYQDSRCLNVAIDDGKDLYQLLLTKNRFVYSILFSREKSFEKLSISTELNWWLDTGIKKYAKAYDKAVAEKGVLPPHLFGQLCRTDKGRKLAEPHLKVILDRLDSKSLSERRGAMFAIAQYGSRPSVTVSKSLANIEAVEHMFKSGLESTSFMYKGTLIAALSMMAQSRYLSDVLDTYGWKIFKFGLHFAVVPGDVMNFVGVLEPVPLSLQTFSKVCISDKRKSEEFEKRYDDKTRREMEKIMKSILQLANPITQKNARADLQTAFQNDPDVFLIPELALCAHEMMEKFNFNPDNRFLISKLLSRTPIARVGEQQVDQEAFAVIQAKIFHFLETMVPVQGIQKIEIKKYTKEQLKANEAKICKKVPEVYLEHDELKKLTGKSKRKFYKMPSTEITVAREKLLE